MTDDRDASAGPPRPDDHEQIDRLAGELLPALVARLAATGLGEIEIRQAGWKLRLRRPPGGAAGGAGYGRRSGDRPSRAQPGHAGHGHAPGALETHRAARAAGSPSSNGARPPGTAVGPGDPATAPGTAAEIGDGGVGRPVVATSPAVGLYQPRADLRPGARVRAGDRIGIVDVLGVPQDVVAPADGILGAGLVDPGQAVEYGQDLVRIELVDVPSARGEG